MRFNCALIHTPQLYKENNKIFSRINFCAAGLFSLSGELEKFGFNTKILHLGIEKYLDKSFKLSQYVKENNIQFLAFSLQWHAQSYNVIETARLIKKENPNLHISLGGFTASCFADEIMNNFEFIDSVIKGEAEMPIVKLVQALSEKLNLDKIPNLYWRKKNKIIKNSEIFVADNDNLNSYSFFNSDKMLHFDIYSKAGYILDYSKNSLNNTPFQTHCISLGRGCLGNCIWCGGGFKAQKIVSNRTFISYRNPDSVVEEMKKLKFENNINLFQFSFDANPNYRKPIIDIFEAIAKEFNGEITANYNLDGLPDKEFLDAFNCAFNSNSTLILSPVFADEKLRKIYKSFSYTNIQLEEILNYMETIRINSDIYFSIMPAIPESENEKSKNYGTYLKQKYYCVKNYYVLPMDIEPASPWTYFPEKFGLKNIKTTFIDYYNSSKCTEESFEHNFQK